MTLRFLYFDLGNVLLSFSNEQACAQVAELAGVTAEEVESLLLHSDQTASFLYRYERGEVTEQQFYERVCLELKCELPRGEMEQAICDMFAPIEESFSLIEELVAANHRLGVLSNTNPMHWRFVTDGRYPLLNQAFELTVTSFAARAMKPEPTIYRHAIEQAGVDAHEIFFVDDRAENVAGAIAVGIDAVQFEDTATLREQLQQRGVLR